MTALAISTATTLGGCAPSLATLPKAPAAFGAPVPVPTVKAGDDAKATAARALGALAQANGALSNDRAFYSDVRRNFSGDEVK